MKKKIPERQLATWDRRPWPKRGDRSATKLFAAVGMALTQWEYLETELAHLFEILATGGRSTVARRAFSAVRTFEGRVEMLKAASEAYFSASPNAEVQNQLKDLVRNSSSLSPRRNEIAHGIVAGFWKGSDRSLHLRVKGQYGLYPSFANYKNRRLNQAPDYCYSSKEVGYFIEQFGEQIMLASYVGASFLGHTTRPLQKPS